MARSDDFEDHDFTIGVDLDGSGNPGTPRAGESDHYVGEAGLIYGQVSGFIGGFGERRKNVAITTSAPTYRGRKK